MNFCLRSAINVLMNMEALLRTVSRLLREVTEAVKSVWPAENPLFVRISATDWTEGGWTIEESVKLASF